MLKVILVGLAVVFGAGGTVLWTKYEPPLRRPAAAVGMPSLDEFHARATALPDGTVKEPF